MHLVLTPVIAILRELRDHSVVIEGGGEGVEVEDGIEGIMVMEKAKLYFKKERERLKHNWKR